MKTSLVIPALNEADVIGPLLLRIPRGVVNEVVVVDNGSSDDTAGVAVRAGARVVTEPRRGYGSACWAGVGACSPAAEVVVFLDGDGSQRPEELPSVLAPILARYGRRLTDIGPFRAIRVDLLQRLGMRDRAFGWPAEMVVKAAALEARIVEVPVFHGPRLAGESKVSGTVVGSARAAYGFLRAALRAAAEVG